jgi:hypothetical protein
MIIAPCTYLCIVGSQAKDAQTLFEKTKITQNVKKIDLLIKLKVSL